MSVPLCVILFLRRWCHSPTHSHTFTHLTHSLNRYTYDRRITDDDPNVESGWNIWNISASLSWLDRFDSPRDALSACLDRSLIFPYVFEKSYSLACTRKYISTGTLVSGYSPCVVYVMFRPFYDMVVVRYSTRCFVFGVSSSPTISVIL